MLDKDKRCAPTKTFNENSCISTNVLVEMAKAYNKSVGFDKEKMIKLNHTNDTLNPNGYKKYLINEFTDRLSGVCKDQICWTSQKFIKYMNDDAKNELKNETFRPSGPSGRFAWLSTVDIDKVLSQYEKKYPDFKFLGAVPIDFDDLDDLGIKNLNFNELKKEGKTKIGIVFNLDEHYKSGSHWVASYADLNKGEIYFSDSYAMRPPQQVRKFLRRIANHCKQEGGLSDIKADYNRTRHQKEGSECGVYSINFILRLLKGEDFYSITKNRIPDKKVNKCRRVYFNNANFKTD